MFLYWAVLFFFNPLHAANAANPARECVADLGSCAYYECLEDNKHCGPDGYLMGFAYKYCRRSVTSLKDKMDSQRAEEWIEKTSLCLQKKVDTQVSCDQLKENSYESHSVCYVESGFCELTFEEKILILNSIREEALSPRAWRQLFKITGQCLSKKSDVSE